jgi:hypothetical protein
MDRWSYDPERRVVHDENGLKVAAEVTPEDAALIVGAPELAEVGLQLHGTWGSKSQAALDAYGKLGDVLVEINGAPLMFRGPLNPDAPVYPEQGAEAPAPPADPPLFAVIADMLAYQAEQFDGDAWFARCGTATVGPFGSKAEAKEYAVRPGWTVEHREGYDLHVSGADLVDAFAAWRPQLRAALAAGRDKPGA